jgi:hypothetical protein
MGRANGNWMVVNEMKVDGSCHCHTELDGEAPSKADEVEKCIHIQSNQKGLYHSKACSNATLNSGRQASVLSTTMFHLIFQSAYVSASHMIGLLAPSVRSDNEEYPSYIHSFNPSRREVSKGSSIPSTASTASTASQPDLNLYIPRAADSIPALLRVPGLFPHLKENNIEEWVRICEHYRDRAYSGGEIDYLEPLNPEDLEGLSHFQQTTAVDNQQNTPDVEYRQTQDLCRNTADAGDKSKSRMN